ncbi:COG4-domain-containing protein [Wolfiporia cocos MD-104 SS10]|uniref:Conserved oligomeric Golgi complex subunit 4 n=1 Tax=Wolfiporia cocos (strain MD-104) TaxID=742152 RepID=A0A2H3JB02_WOLCO|nr:COG4-domain-containing protein [Wolfiporia cocos MD-104 SS10]
MSAMSDVEKLATLPDILSCLSALQSEEAELSQSLTDLVSSRESISDALTRLQGLRPHLDNLHDTASAFAVTVSGTAQTAENVGGRVKSLDEEMHRVREAAERVNQVMELKSSLAELQTSMEQKDWEAATRHCARAMALPAAVISGPFAGTTVPTAESHLPPAQTLQSAREELLQVFRQEFDKASRERDAAATSRFFKLFPAIGWEAEGLDVYANFVVDLVRIRAPASAKKSSPLYYITAITALLENIALVVDQHQPVVEKYYGPGKMVPVLERLLREADRGVKDLIDGWEEERMMKRKLSDITGDRPGAPIQRVDEDIVDPRDIDAVLTELSGMGSRWGLFRKFMYDRLKNDPSDDGEAVNSRPSTPKPAMKPVSESDDVLPSGMDAVDNCEARKILESTLITYYIPLEVWYARTTIDKAHRLSTADAQQIPAVTTAPDDAFYILKMILGRMLSCGAADIIKRTGTALQEVVERDYTGVIRKKLDDVYRTGGVGMKGDKAEREMRQAFIILLNDLDVSASHMERLIKELSSSPLIHQYFLDSEVESVRASINSFNTLVPKFRSALRAGIEQVFNQLLRPKLRTFIPDVYRDVSYVLDDDSYAAAEAQNIVPKRFIKAWEGLVDGYKDLFTEHNYRMFFGLVLDVLVRPWERFILTLKYSELGAIRFDHDLRAVTSYLSSQTAFGDTREKFVRLQQISTLLNLDVEEDIDEFYNGSGIAWQLGEQEAHAVAGLRT